MWTENCYQKIEKQINAKVDAVDKKELSLRLQKIFEDYLQITNVKAVYRDVVIESEYNPFDDKQNVIKVDVRGKSRDHPDGIVDHLNEQIDKVLERHEGQMHLLEGGGRSTLPVEEWDVVETTPVGFAARVFADSLKPPDSNEALRGRVLRGKSDAVAAGFDHYNYLRGREGEAVALKEAFNVGKRCFPSVGLQGSPVFTTTNELFRDRAGLGSMAKEKRVNGRPPFAVDTSAA